jgi:aminoglycoside 3-N-acetyltransferase
MSIDSIYNKIAEVSPHIEVLLRRIYWNNVNAFVYFKPKFRSTKSVDKNTIFCDFSEITDFLEKMKVSNGSLLIVRSSYDVLRGTGLSPDGIIDKLLKLIGEDGTLGPAQE